MLLATQIIKIKGPILRRSSVALIEVGVVGTLRVGSGLEKYDLCTTAASAVLALGV